MSDSAVIPQHGVGSRPAGGPRLEHGIHLGGVVAFLAVLVAGLGYAVVSLIADMNAVGEAPLAYGAFALLGLALLIALAFEFVNGFHDTANAVATVIYTHSMPPLVAVVWSGFFNFLGVMLSSGAVAYAIVTLLPVELILHVGSGAGYAMIFALLLAAIIWNLGTWAFGLPNSSSHALIGSVLGVGLANQLMGGGDGTAGVDWNQAFNVFKALLFSPLCGFALAALLLLALKFAVRRKDLYEAPKGETPPPVWIRGLLILTCTLVSFFHGGNDGQKGMGLIMLILIGAAPTAYALNRTMSDDTTPAFIQSSAAASQVFSARAAGAPQPEAAQARRTVTDALKSKDLNQPPVYAALRARHGHRHQREELRRDPHRPGRPDREPAQRHVPHRRRGAAAAQRRRGSLRGRDDDPEELHRAAQQRHPLHPGLGEGLRRPGARPRHHGRLEAHRRHGGRAHRQDPPHLRPGRLGRDGRRGDDRARRTLRPAGLDHAHPVLGRRRDDGGQRLGPADGHGAQHGARLDPDPAGCHHAGRDLVLPAAPRVLTPRVSGGSSPAIDGQA
jgi:phosphate/sulfate permease